MMMTEMNRKQATNLRILTITLSLAADVAAIMADQLTVDRKDPIWAAIDDIERATAIIQAFAKRTGIRAPAAPDQG